MVAGMDQDLARLYGTPGHTPEDTQLLAEAQMFAKVAADNGYDISKLNDDQVQTLWDHVFPKVAEGDEAKKDEEKKEEKKDESAPPPFAKKDEEEEKKAAVAAEHREKLARVNEEARADYLGRKMAHAYVAELRAIGESQEAEAKTASATPTATPAPAEVTEVKEAAMPPALAKALGKVRGAAGKGADFAKSHKDVAVGAAGGVAASAVAHRLGKKKESSAIDAAALELAVKMAHDAGMDSEDVADKVLAVLTLGGPQSEKVASTPEAQIQVRALEFLEAAGYPVEWAQPQQ